MEECSQYAGWFPLSRTVKALCNNHQALYIHFKRASENQIVNTELYRNLSILKDYLAQLSTLSEGLQEWSRSILDANKQIKWTVNALIKIKGDVNDGKYNFNKMIGENSVFKEVHFMRTFQDLGIFYSIKVNSFKK